MVPLIMKHVLLLPHPPPRFISRIRGAAIALHINYHFPCT